MAFIWSHHICNVYMLRKFGNWTVKQSSWQSEGVSLALYVCLLQVFNCFVASFSWLPYANCIDSLLLQTLNWLCGISSSWLHVTSWWKTWKMMKTVDKKIWWRVEANTIWWLKLCGQIFGEGNQGSKTNWLKLWTIFLGEGVEGQKTDD